MKVRNQMDNRFLYRAKRKDNGEWVQGYVFDDGFENERIFIGGLVIEKYQGFACDEWNIAGKDFAEVDRSTICRHVPCGCSLDEKQIWEDDIVTNGRYVGIVEYGPYETTHLGFYIQWMNADEELRKDFLYWFPKIKVIGNIYDNQEMLRMRKNEKVVFLMDKPESCEDCEIYESCRKRWNPCPLKRIPEKMRVDELDAIDNPKGYDFGYFDGWNGYLLAMIGEEE